MTHSNTYVSIEKLSSCNHLIIGKPGKDHLYLQKYEVFPREIQRADYSVYTNLTVTFKMKYNGRIENVLQES